MKSLQRKNNRYNPIERRLRVPLREEVDWPALPPGEQKKGKCKPPNKREERLPSIGQKNAQLVERIKTNKNRYNPIERRPRVPLREEVDWPALPPGEQKKGKCKPPNKREERLPSIGQKNAQLMERIKTNKNRYNSIERRPRVPLREEVDWPALPPGEQKKGKCKPPNKREERLPCIGQKNAQLVERIKKNKNRYNPIERRPRVPLREKVDWPALPPGEQKKGKCKPPNKREERLPSIGQKNAQLVERIKKNKNRYNPIERRPRFPLREEVDWPALPPGEQKKGKRKPPNKCERRLTSSSQKYAQCAERRKNKRQKNEEDNNQDAGEERPARRVENTVGGNATRPKKAKKRPGDFRIKNFKFHKVIGKGGFGKVALVTHKATKIKMAVKVVKKKTIIKEQPKTIIIEKKALKKMGNSPLFTHAYGTFHTEDYFVYVMEYLRGGDLNKLMKSKGPLPTDTIRFIAAELLCALQQLHSRGIMHRDMKPGNVLLDDSGHVKVADFGLSHIGVFEDRNVNSPVGTPGYAAPEVIEGKPYNTEADYYSLGVILLQMALGPNVLQRDNEEPYPYVDPDLLDVAKRLTEVNPRKRMRATRNLRRHRFFKDIDWQKMETGKATPPFQMRLRKEIDTRKEIDVEKIIPPVRGKKMIMSPVLQKLMQGFNFISNKWKKMMSM